MIFVTGDTHGDWMQRLNHEAFPEQAEMTKEDYVIICGDFGKKCLKTDIWQSSTVRGTAGLW